VKLLAFARGGPVIATRTPAGVGHHHQPPQYLAGGDVMRCGVEGIGALENQFVDAAPPVRDHTGAAGIDALATG